MNAQQAAPSGTSIFAQHSFRDSAIQIASRIAHSKSGGTSHNKKPIATTVSIVLDILENNDQSQNKDTVGKVDLDGGQF